MRRYCRMYASVLLVVGILVCMMYGQSNRAVIVGTVLDQSGSPVPNAKVAVVWLLGSNGMLSIIAVGAVRSIVQLNCAGVGSVPPAAVARTWNV